ncbi:hypothetical protein K2173_000713 [Erythroxylum novogranatense]|uniref:Uncharacterized protein n=1 Tax=Erythroxylum novogranatense TaxID=1862640 RepID=A0AAV8SIA6_9ROSI|nr:hypothetical protein K2173_000713 [Erythroxylum novogranatense]
MPRSSRHKSSKHNSRDAKEYSDSESSKDRRGEERESSARVSKDSSFGEKRKQLESGNADEYCWSKRRKERVDDDDDDDDRWNGGEDDDRVRGGGDGTKNSKEKSRRREWSEELVMKKISTSGSGKSEAKRKEDKEEGTEREREKDRKSKEGKSEKFADGEDQRAVKHFSHKTEFISHNLLQSLESNNQLDRRSRRRRDGSGDREKHQDDKDIDDKLFSSKGDVDNDGRSRDEKCKQEKYKDKYCEDVDRENRCREDKQKYKHSSRDYTSSKLDDNHLRDKKESMDILLKISRPPDDKNDHERDDDLDCDYDFDLKRDCDNYHDRNRDGICDDDRDQDLKHGRDCVRERDQVQDQDRELDHDHDWDWDRDRERYHAHDRDWNRDIERDRDSDNDRDKDQELEQAVDFDEGDADERISKYKDSQKGRKRSDEFDDYVDRKCKAIQTYYPDMEKKPFGSNKVESDIDRARSHSRQPHLDNNVTNNRWRSSESIGSADEYRHFKPDEPKHRDAVTEAKPKTISSRESERASKYKSSERSTKFDDLHMVELSLERSSTSKALPLGLVKRSPSSSSLERRFTNRSGTRRSLDIEESNRSSSSMGARDLVPCNERHDLPLEKQLMDDLIPNDSPFYYRNSQSNPAVTPAFRGGVGSPFIGVLEEDNRINSGARYKQSVDPILGRGQGNNWRGAPNWSSPMPNGYIPFQHGPPHGNFQTLMPQFATPPLFGVRPSIENHSGMAYHITDVDRFSGHLRPLGWQNMMNGSGNTHVHGWDGSNGVYRGEMHMYGGSEWEQNRHPMNGQGWETGVDRWKGQNCDSKTDLPSKSLIEDSQVQAQAPVDALYTGQGGQKSENENGYNGLQEKTHETKPAGIYSAKESSELSKKYTNEKMPCASEISTDFRTAYSYSAYLSKLDISTELTSLDIYSQFLSSLNLRQNTIVDDSMAMLVNLKCGAKAVSKSSNSLFNPSLFSAKRDSVHKRALRIYKKQKLLVDFPSVNSRQVGLNSVSKMEEQVLVSNVIAAQNLTLSCEGEMNKAAVADLGQVKAEATTVACGPTSEEMVPSDNLVTVRDHDPPVKLDMLDEVVSHYGPPKPTHTVSGDHIDASEGESAAADASDGHNMDETCKIKDNVSFSCAEEGQGLGDAMYGSLLSSDDPCKASEDLMVGSNESESVILSRIHHSPENTH